MLTKVTHYTAWYILLIDPTCSKHYLSLLYTWVVKCTFLISTHFFTRAYFLLLLAVKRMHSNTRKHNHIGQVSHDLYIRKWVLVEAKKVPQVYRHSLLGKGQLSISNVYVRWVLFKSMFYTLKGNLGKTGTWMDIHICIVTLTYSSMFTNRRC